MAFVLKSILFVFILCCLLFCESAAGKKKLKPKRINLLQKIKKCQHWKFSPTDDPHVAEVNVLLHNDEKVTRKLSVALKCNTTKKLREPSSPYKVTPGKSREVSFAIAVDYRYFHHEASVHHQQCLLATWTDDGRLFNCRFNIRIWPNGLFYYKCVPFQKGQFGVKIKITSKAMAFNMKNTGTRSFYIVNSTCKPTVPTLKQPHLYKRLERDQTWALDFPLKCSGVTNMNYKGKCFVTVYHVCGTTTTFLWHNEFPYHDGEVEECEHVKSSLGVYEPGILSTLWGTSDMSSIALAMFIVFELVVILGTIVIKMIVQRSLKR